MRSHSLALAALLALGASGGLADPAAPSPSAALGEAVLQEPQETPNPGYFGSGHQAQPAPEAVIAEPGS